METWMEAYNRFEKSSSDGRVAAAADRLKSAGCKSEANAIVANIKADISNMPLRDQALKACSVGNRMDTKRSAHECVSFSKDFPLDFVFSVDRDFELSRIRQSIHKQCMVR